MKYKTFRNLFLLGVVVVIGGGIFAWVKLAPDEPARATATGPRQATTEARGAPASALPAGAPRHVAWLTSRLGQPAPAGGKQKDALGRGAPKVNVYEEGGVWARAKVDLDRDEKWDEKWDLKGGRIERRVAAADDERYGEAQVLGGGARAPEPSAAKAPALPAGALALRKDEERIRARLSSAVTKKVKDLFRGQGAKVNLYADDGKRFNRAKVDLDRDEKWDEKWTMFADGQIEKKIAPADDERYTKTYLLKNGAWHEKR